jgi:hypothetical protein
MSADCADERRFGIGGVFMEWGRLDMFSFGMMPLERVGIAGRALVFIFLFAFYTEGKAYGKVFRCKKL